MPIDLTFTHSRKQVALSTLTCHFRPLHFWIEPILAKHGEQRIKVHRRVLVLVLVSVLRPFNTF